MDVDEIVQIPIAIAKTIADTRITREKTVPESEVGCFVGDGCAVLLVPPFDGLSVGTASVKLGVGAGVLVGGEGTMDVGGFVVGSCVGVLL